MAVLNREELESIFIAFKEADLEERIDIAYQNFSDLLDTIEYWRRRARDKSAAEEVKTLKRKGLITEH